MSLSEIQNVVLLFTNPVWAGGSTVPTTILRNITSLSSPWAESYSITKNITTLTTSSSETLNGEIQGLLYVPDVSPTNRCSELQYEDSVGLPRNVTRKNDLPPTNYKIIAIAPWFSEECTKAYLNASRYNAVRAFIFYRPNNSTAKPSDKDTVVWDLDGSGAWKDEFSFPIFAIPGADGQKLVDKLALYSGTIEEAPHGTEILENLGPNPRDYIRVWTTLTIKDTKSLPALWTFFVIVIGALLAILAIISVSMHMIQRRRRHALERRIENGEVDLEKIGIARMLLPRSYVNDRSSRGLNGLFTYQDHSRNSQPPTPRSTTAPTVSARSSRQIQERSISAMLSTTARSRTSIASEAGDVTATNDQPVCILCDDAFRHGESVIRQLKCGHIFHPECIDQYLTTVSSLCPVAGCRVSMWPRGFHPKITNLMVQKERHYQKGTKTIQASMEDDAYGEPWSRLMYWLDSLLSRFSKFGSHSKAKEHEHEMSDMSPSSQTCTTLAEDPASASSSTASRNRSLTPNESPAGIPAVLPPDPTPPQEPTDAVGSPPDPQEENEGLAPLPTDGVSRPRPRGSRPRRSRPRLDPQPIGPAPSSHQPGGPLEVSNKILERMEHMAEPLNPAIDINNTPKWKKVLGKIFPLIG